MVFGLPSFKIMSNSPVLYSLCQLLLKYKFLSLTITDVYPNELTFMQQLHDNELLNDVDLSGLEFIETMLFIDTI